MPKNNTSCVKVLIDVSTVQYWFGSHNIIHAHPAHHIANMETKVHLFVLSVQQQPPTMHSHT